MLCLLLPGCGLMQTAVETPERVVRAVVPGGEQAAPPTEDLLPDLLRYADLIVLRAEAASLRFADATATPEAELQAARWRLESIRWTTQIATGPNSLTGILDLVAFSTMLGFLQEDHWIPAVWGEAARPMLSAHQQAAQEGWLLLERYLTAEELQQARAILADWRAANPLLTESTTLEFPGFGPLAAGRGPAGEAGPSLTSRLGLDPLAGLEPAMRQVELTRQFGMRALYFFQRAPRLVAAEVEYRSLALRQSAEARQLLADVARATAALESFAATAASLPAALSSEREAALRQAAEILEARLAQAGALLDAQRGALLADLEQSRAPLESLLQETQAALAAGRDMSAELTLTAQAFDALAARFDGPEGEAPAPAAAAGPAAEPAAPFDIAEYGRAAEQVGQAAAELRQLVTSLDQSLPQTQRLLDETAARGEQAMDHAALRMLQVGLILIGAAVMAVLILRRRR